MSLMSKLSIRQLKLNPKRTFITLLGIILSVGMITAVAGFVFSMQATMRDLYIASDGDWHAAIYNVTETQAAAIAADEIVGTSFTRADENSGALGLHFRLKNPTREYPATAKLLAARYGVEMPEFRDNKELLAVEGVIENDAYFISANDDDSIPYYAIFVISNAFNISANERLNQFGLLKSAGATKKQIRACVLSEGLTLAGVGIPVMYMTATAQATILRVLPARWMVAQRGTVKPAISGRTPFFNAHCKVTGIVAADDCVPSAVI